MKKIKKRIVFVGIVIIVVALIVLAAVGIKNFNNDFAKRNPYINIGVVIKSEYIQGSLSSYPTTVLTTNKGVFVVLGLIGYEKDKEVIVAPNRILK